MRKPLQFVSMLALGILQTDAAMSRECASFQPMAGPQTLQGRLISHHGLRDWVELAMDKRLCGESSIELVRDHDEGTFETFAGCRVRTKGRISEAASGYSMTAYNQDVQRLGAIGTCQRTPRQPDLSKRRADPRVHDYLVELDINASPGDHPALVRVTSHDRVLRPWQAYADTFLTGGNVLYAGCAKGFAVDVISGPPYEVIGHMDSPRLLDDRAAFDADPVGHPNNTYAHVMYTCTRDIERD